MAYSKEPFQELDVMNNFMFNKLTSEEETKEDFCKLLLKNLIGKEPVRVIVQAEKIVLPDNPDRRGVRLDVLITEKDEHEQVAKLYDIEPHRNKEADYPKKNRYVQAQIDKSNLECGERDFRKLPELNIICLLNYDPFGYDRMVYTVQKGCVEEPEIVYNDGVTIYYFNTTGTKGGSPALKSFLTYLEASEEQNVVDEATREVDTYVKKIKNRPEMEGAYMTVGDWIDGIVAEAVEEKDKALADKDAEIANIIISKDAILADKDAEIACLKEELARQKSRG